MIWYESAILALVFSPLLYDQTGQLLLLPTVPHSSSFCSPPLTLAFGNNLLLAALGKHAEGSESLSISLETLPFSGPNYSRNRACFCKKIHSQLPACPPSPAPGDSRGLWGPRNRDTCLSCCQRDSSKLFRLVRNAMFIPQRLEAGSWNHCYLLDFAV